MSTKNLGALRRYLGARQGDIIPKAKIVEPERSKSATKRKQANLAVKKK